MRRCKRSERLALPLLAGVLGLGVLGCSAGGGSSPFRAVQSFDPVAVMSTPAELSAGVHAEPLEPGESLAFNVGPAQSVAWTMRGVSYPLELRAVLDDGTVSGPWLMPACNVPIGPCAAHEPGAVATWWIETRPG